MLATPPALARARMQRRWGLSRREAFSCRGRLADSTHAPARVTGNSGVVPGLRRVTGKLGRLWFRYSVEEIFRKEVIGRNGRKRTKNTRCSFHCNCLILGEVARPERFELPAFWFVGRWSKTSKCRYWYRLRANAPLILPLSWTEVGRKFLSVDDKSGAADRWPGEIPAPLIVCAYCEPIARCPADFYDASLS